MGWLGIYLIDHYYGSTTTRALEHLLMVVRITVKPLKYLLSATNDYFRHDLWHFFGGAGLFFIFMFILTIDEDIRYKERDKIAVF